MHRGSLQIFILLLLAPLVFTPCLGQQNLFNVASSDITLQGEPFFQQQLNFNKGQIQFNTTFDWGIGKQSEIGFNVISINLNTGREGPLLMTNHTKTAPPLYPIYAINIQKALSINDHFKVALGTQSGLSNTTFVDFTYFNLVTAISKTHTKLITGAYFGTNTFLGIEERNPIIKRMNPIGFQFGLEEQFIPEKFSVIFESITGKHSLGESSAGLAYYLNHNWIVSSAFQFANPQSTSQNALVMELTYCPSSKVHTRPFKHSHMKHLNQSHKLVG